MSRLNGWQFAIDVGGTFTDCLAIAPDGSQRAHKLLSSGLTLGKAAQLPTGRTLIDPLRISNPEGFWIGYRLRIPAISFESLVTDFDAELGSLMLRDAIPDPQLMANENWRYELRCDEESPTIAIRHVLGLRLSDPLPDLQLRMGTTKGTNALLTGSGARTALLPRADSRISFAFVTNSVLDCLTSTFNVHL